MKENHELYLWPGKMEIHKQSRKKIFNFWMRCSLTSIHWFIFIYSFSVLMNRLCCPVPESTRSFFLSTRFRSFYTWVYSYPNLLSSPEPDCIQTRREIWYCNSKTDTHSHLWRQHIGSVLLMRNTQMSISQFSQILSSFTLILDKVNCQTINSVCNFIIINNKLMKCDFAGSPFQIAMWDMEYVRTKWSEWILGFSI